MLSTVARFRPGFVVSLTFVAIVLVFSIARSIPVAIVWGLFLLILVSYIINKSNRQNSLKEIVKHVLVAVVVIVLSRVVGILIVEHF